MYLSANLSREPIVTRDDCVLGECRVTSGGKAPSGREHGRDARGDGGIAGRAQRERRRGQQPRGAREDHGGEEQFLAQKGLREVRSLNSIHDRFWMHGSEKE
jgi:hypothetical protein